MNNTHSTMSVVAALEAKLSSLLFPAEMIPSTVTEVSAGQPIFEIVSKQSTPSLASAVAKAIAVTKRLACVVPARERWEPLQGNLGSRRWQQFLILMSAVDWNPFAATAFFGDAQKVGLLDIKDFVIQEIYGESLNLPGVIVAPRAGESARFTENENQLDDIREGYILTIDVCLGVQTACVKRGSTPRRL